MNNKRIFKQVSSDFYKRAASGMSSKQIPKRATSDLLQRVQSLQHKTSGFSQTTASEVQVQVQVNFFPT